MSWYPLNVDFAVYGDAPLIWIGKCMQVPVPMYMHSNLKYVYVCMFMHRELYMYVHTILFIHRK